MSSGLRACPSQKDAFRAAKAHFAALCATYDHLVSIVDMISQPLPCAFAQIISVVKQAEMSAEHSQEVTDGGSLMETANFYKARPNECYVLEIDGKIKSEYGIFAEALKAGLKIKQQFPQSDVKVHNANE